MSNTIVSAQERSTWQIDSAHSVVEFAVRHMMISTVKGSLPAVRGTIRLDEEDPTRSAVEVEIEAASIDTRQADRDAHLRSADFLDVERYPVITFRSRRIESTGEERFRVVGDLTLRGETREVVLDAIREGQATDPWGGERTGFSATTRIDRREFGLTWNQALETGGILVGTELRITLEVQAVKAAA